MALTKIIRQECPVCKKIAVEESRIKFGTKTTLIKLACGHLLTLESMASEEKAYDSIVFSDGCKPRPYQIDAVRFAEESNVRCIIADEAGLGKTIEALGLIRLHAAKLLPCVIVCPSTVKLQWMYEICRICCDKDKGFKDERFLTQVIKTSKDLAMPGFQIYIVTYDVLKNDKLFSLLPDGEIKTIIIDECQRIKNHLSERAKAVQRVAKGTPHIISMSGTPIKNNAGEYFTVLNLTKPTLFPHYQKYIDNYCDSYSSGWGQKIGGLKDAERFHEDTKDIIIRRTKSDVLKELPSIARQFHHVELDRKLHKAYAALMDELEELFYGEDSFATEANKMAIRMKLRHITGISKVEADGGCIDFITEFLLSTDRKIVVFVHHQDVMGLLEIKLNTWLADGGFGPCVVMHSGLNGEERTKAAKEFENNLARRVMIASTLAAGEGLNLQFCSDAVILERQWNPANEEQAEGRFHRFGQKNPVSITYMISSGTIDEYFTQLVEVKRQIVASTLDKKEIQWDQPSLMKELDELLLIKGRKAWSL